MTQFSHYEIDRIVYTGDKFIIYHARDLEDQKPVYLKALKAELPDLKDVARLQREYNLLSQLDAPEIIKCLDVVKEGHQVAIVMEDIMDGLSLQEYCKIRPCGIDDFLDIAIQIVQGLIALHEKKIIHKDIKPSNILISRKNHAIKIIDFGISTQLSRENPEVASNNIMEGSLPYISPEQTGMVNTPLDYRTDFYSLGITFYEMLTQQYPLKGENYKEWANAHVSLAPKPLRELNPEIPRMIADIIMRLIEKIPKNRYQNFSSLKKDLQECQQQFLKNKKIEPFQMNTDDLSDHFEISEKLYGRESEIQELINTFNSVTAGDRALLLISGYSGAGKSTLVGEIKQTVLEKKAYYASGKVDQYNQNIPYSAFVEAFKEIIKCLFQENDVAYNKISIELKQALYPNEKILIDIIPSLEKILGSSENNNENKIGNTSETRLATLEDENRFKLAIKNFIKVFAKKEHPLVLFLDDLQWAGSAAFELLKTIILDRSIESLLIIGAYRDNEVDESHPLSFMIHEIDKIKPIQKIELAPLKQDAVLQIISDTLHCSAASALPITHVLYEKAEGNPFFTLELLKNLHRERHIDFNYEEGHWEWDIEKIKSVTISENVVEFMISRLKQLPESTLELLKKASCIGNRFDLNLLALVSERDEASVSDDLLKAIQLGILSPTLSDYELASFYDYKTSNSQVKFHAVYQFQHDRIQQAAYEMMDEKEKSKIHFLIGKRLLATYSGAKMDAIVVSIADHLNKGKALISSEEDLLELAELNLAAGIKAKASIAYHTAYEFLKTGISLLKPGSWNSHYQLAFDLYEHFSQSAFLCGEFLDSENSNQILLIRAKTSLEKAKIHRICAVQYTINGKSEMALDSCINGLRLLKIKFRKNASTLSVLKELFKTKIRQGLKPIKSLSSLSRMQDPEKIVSIQLLMEMVAPCYTLGHKNLFASAILRQVGLSIRYGNTKESSYAYAAYGLLLGEIFNQPSSGFEFGKMAVALNKNLGDISLRCRILFVFYSFIFPWHKPLKELYSMYEEIIKVGYQSGDLLYVNYATQLCLLLPPENTLTDCVKIGLKYIEMVSVTKYEDAILLLKVFQQFRLSLQNRGDSQYFKINSENEKIFLKMLKKQEYDSLVTGYLIKKLIDCYIFNDYTQAEKILDEAENSLEAMLGSLITEEFYLFATLTLARHYSIANRREQRKALSRMTQYYKKIKKWSAQCEANFLQHALLLEATLLRIKGKNKKAARAYDQAITAAQKNNFLHDEALICEEAAHFYHDTLDSTNEKKHLKQAHYAYLKWGALAKVALLEQEHPELASPQKPPPTTFTKAKSDTITL